MIHLCRWYLFDCMRETCVSVCVIRCVWLFVYVCKSLCRMRKQFHGWGRLCVSTALRFCLTYSRGRTSAHIWGIIRDCVCACVCCVCVWRGLVSIAHARIVMYSLQYICVHGFMYLELHIYSEMVWNVLPRVEERFQHGLTIKKW